MEFIFIIAILLMSVVIHEVSHGYAALWLGDPTAKLQNRLTLNPLRHLDPLGSFIVPTVAYLLGGIIIGWAKPVPYNPYNFKKLHKIGDALVAAAGPAVNIILALIFSILVRMSAVYSFSPSFIEISSYVILINIILAFFNLIPIPPLDGSKILFTFLPRSMIGIRILIERYSIVAILIFIFFLWRFLAPVVTFSFSLLTGLGLPI